MDKKESYPFGHLVSVSVSMMVIQNEDRTDDTAGDHKHDAIEICPCNIDRQRSLSPNEIFYLSF